MQRVAALLLCGLLLTVPASAHDEGVGFDPAAAAGLFPDPAEVLAAIQAAAAHPHATLIQVGSSQDEHPLYVLEYVLPGIPVQERVVTFIMTQQHGNEPAGTPAAMDLFGRIDNGELDALLANQVLIVMPQSNPDGSFDNRRTGEDGTDINRDHVGLRTPEARAIHAVLARWDVHIAFDHHEYGGIGLGAPVPVRIYDWDITTMYPNHGNVRAPTRALAETMNYEHIYPFVQSQGYSIGDYGWQGVGVSGAPGGDVWVPLQQTAGGPDPGILRNNYGLNNVVGLLVESFVAPAENPLASFERRVGAHAAVMEAVIRFAHAEADTLIDTKRESERLNRESPPTQYMEGATSSPLPAAFWTDADVTQTIRAHDLPPGIPADGGLVWNLDSGRAGLLAAMFSPGSSRAVADAQPHDAVRSEAVEVHRDYTGTWQAEPDEAPPIAPLDRDASAAPIVLVLLAALALAAGRRR